MRQRYRTQGLWGLVDRRSLRPKSALGRADPRVVKAVTAAVERETTESTGTKTRLRRRVTQALDDEHGPGAVELPSPATFNRLADVLSAGRHTFGAATTRRTQANRPATPFTPTSAARPGEIVQVDSTPLDVMAVLDDGVTGRVEMTTCIDIATRTLCTAVLRPVATKAVDAALLLARMLVPEPMRPGWPEALAMARSALPHARLVSLDARLEQAAARPVIVPETIACDRGKVFLSDTFLSACQTLGISVQPARSLTPTDKAIVERTFCSINTLFCQHLVGYTGSNVTRRGTDPEDGAAWALADLQDLLDEWVVACWQNRPHEGLRHPWTPRVELSPNEMYAALVAVAGYVPVTLCGDDYIELLPVCWRAVNDDGIRIDYRTYDSAELGPYRRRPSPASDRRGLWEVHYDPYDVSRVWPGALRAASSPPRGPTCRSWGPLSPTSPGARPVVSRPHAARTPATRPHWPGSWTTYCTGPGPGRDLPTVPSPGLLPGTAQRQPWRSGPYRRCLHLTLKTERAQRSSRSLRPRQSPRWSRSASSTPTRKATTGDQRHRGRHP